jgi:hypothetical protein
LKIDDVTSKLAHDDVALMNRGAVGAQYAIQLVEKAFEPLWSYPPIQRAIIRNANGLAFADPEKLETKTLVDEGRTVFGTRTDTNFKKYEWTVMLHAALSSFRTNLNHDAMVRDNYHEKITSTFTQLIGMLNSVKDKIAEIKENGKTFDSLITGVLTQVLAAQANWLEYSASMCSDVNLSQHHDKPHAFYEKPRYTL